MSHSGYFIVPFQPELYDEMSSEDMLSVFTINQQDFLDKLMRRWSGAKTQTSIQLYEWVENNGQLERHQLPVARNKLIWQLPPEENGDFLAGFQLEGSSSISFDAFPRSSVVEFVLWYRKYIPDTVTLYLAPILNIDNSLLLTTETKPQTIRAFIEKF